MSDASRDPRLLRQQLIGEGVWSGRTLLERAAQRVVAISGTGGPSYRTGSIIGQTDHKHDDPDADAERTFDLLIGLVEWQGAGIGKAAGRTRAQLAHQIAKNKQSDIELLLGNPKQKYEGHIKRVRDLVVGMLRQPKTADLERCRDLAVFLGEWLFGPCDHDFREIELEGQTFHVCGCEAAFKTDKRGRIAQVSAGELSLLRLEGHLAS